MARLPETKQLSDAVADTMKKLNVVSEVESEQREKSQTVNDPKDKVLVNFRWGKERILRYKKFFGGRGMSLSQGILFCIEDEIYRTETKEIIFTDTGIRPNKLAGI